MPNVHVVMHHLYTIITWICQYLSSDRGPHSHKGGPKILLF